MRETINCNWKRNAMWWVLENLINPLPESRTRPLADPCHWNRRGQDMKYIRLMEYGKICEDLSVHFRWNCAITYRAPKIISWSFYKNILLVGFYVGLSDFDHSSYQFLETLISSWFRDPCWYWNLVRVLGSCTIRPIIRVFKSDS